MTQPSTYPGPEIVAESPLRLSARAPLALTTAPSVSIVVPIFNSTELASTLRRIETFLASFDRRSELVLVDDCSEAPTRRVLERMAAEASQVTTLRNRRNRGKGFCVRRGMLAASGDYRVFVDSDLAYSPTEVGKIIDALDDGADIAIACRWLPGSRHVVDPTTFLHTYERHLMSRAFNFVVRHALLPGILDSQAGLKGFTADAAESIFPLMSTPGFGFDVECLYLARAQGRQIVQTAVTVHCDDHRSTIRLGRDSARMLRDIARVRRRARRHDYDDERALVDG
jgi:dolichyl-phosphate beta-glucosyltransferase